MATLPTLVPNSDVQVGTWTTGAGGTTNLYLGIDETIGSADGTTIRGPAGAASTGTSSYEAGLTNMPADFIKMDTLSHQVRYAQTGRSDDTIGFRYRIINSAATVVLAGATSTLSTAWVTFANITTTTQTNSTSTAFAYVNTTATKTDWDGAVLEIEQTYTVSMASDNARILIDAIQLTGTYTAGVTLQRTASGSGTGTDSASRNFYTVFQRTASGSGTGSETASRNFYTIFQRTATGSGTGTASNTQFKQLYRTAPGSGAGTSQNSIVCGRLRTGTGSGAAITGNEAVGKHIAPRTATGSGTGTQSILSGIRRAKSATGSGIGTSLTFGYNRNANNKWNDSIYSVTFNSKGYKFYGLDVPYASTIKKAGSAIFIESDFIATVTEMYYGQITVSGDVTLTASGKEIQFAKADLSGSAVAVTISLEQVQARIAISIDSSLTVTAKEILFASSTTSGDVTTSISATRVACAISTVSGDLSVSAVGKEIQFPVISISATSSLSAITYKSTWASSSTSGDVNLTIAGTKIQNIASTADGLNATASATALEIQYASSQINITSNLTASGTEALVAKITLNPDGQLICAATHIRHVQPNIEININTDISIASIKAKSIEDAWTDSYYSVTIPGRGYRFYGVDPVTPLVVVRIYGESTAEISATRLRTVQASISAEASLTCAAKKKLLVMDGDVNLVADADTIAYASASMSVESNVSTTVYEILYTSTSTSSESNVSPTGMEILYASCSLSGSAVSVTIGTEYQLARINIAAQVSMIIASALRFSDAITEDTQNIRTLLIIDNKPITEHNRTLNSTVVQSMIENRNWKSTRARYYKAASGRMIFSISWSQVPNSRNQTVDSRFGRDYISDIGADPDVHILKVLNIDSDGTTPYTEDEYNVIVKSYSESLVRRDLVDGAYYWDCSLELEEV